MLADATARALVEQHCALLGLVCFLPDRRSFQSFYGHVSLARDFLDLHVDPARVTTKRKLAGVDWRDVGARLRLALDVARAVACCRGMDPATNLPFWRHITVTVWKRVDRRYGEWLAFAPDAFARIGVIWRADKRYEDAFWLGFLHGSASCAATLRSVHERLQRHLPTPPGPLQIVLVTCTTKRSPPAWDDGLRLNDTIKGQADVEPEALKTILRAALDGTSTTWTTDGTHLNVVVEYRVDDNMFGVRDLLDLLTRATQQLPWLQITIGRLVVQLVPPVPPRCAGSDLFHRHAFETRACAMGETLRALLAGDAGVASFYLLGCCGSDYRLVGTALSAAALAATPIPDLMCSGLGTWGQDKLLRLGWLAYVMLQRRDRTQQWTLSLQTLGCLMSDDESAYLAQLVASRTPLRDVVGEALRLRFDGDDTKVAQLHNVDCLAFGSKEEDSIDAVVHVVYGDGTAWVGIVPAGYGLVWATASEVVTWHRVESCDEDTSMAGLSALVLAFAASHRSDFTPTSVAAPLRLLACESLVSLSLTRAELALRTLADLLTVSPSLATLKLDRCAIESLAPLVDAYSRRSPHISTLSLLNMRFFTATGPPPAQRARRNARQTPPAWFDPLLTAIADGVMDGILQDLSIEIAGVSVDVARNAFEVLASAIATSTRSLARVHVQCDWGRDQANACWSLFSPLLDKPLRDYSIRASPRARLATLSVLRAFRCEAPGIATEVLAMAQGVVMRTITWVPCSYM